MSIDTQALREAAEKANPEQYGYYLVDAFTEIATPNTVLSLLDELEAAKARIAELEARTLTVNLPDGCEHDVMAPVAAFMYEDGYEFDQEDYTAVAGRVRSELETVLRRALRAAGISVKGE